MEGLPEGTSRLLVRLMVRNTEYVGGWEAVKFWVEVKEEGEWWMEN